MLHPWNSPIYMTRGWCIFELWYAITQSQNCALSIILAPEDRAAFQARINADGTDARAIDEALGNISSEEAEAFSQDDLDRIRALIQSLPGGFTTLDSMIARHLRRWFVSQGGVRVARLQSRSRASVDSDQSLPRLLTKIQVLPAGGAVSAPTMPPIMCQGDPTRRDST